MLSFAALEPRLFRAVPRAPSHCGRVVLSSLLVVCLVLSSGQSVSMAGRRAAEQVNSAVYPPVLVNVLPAKLGKFQDFAPSIAHLQETLEEFGILGDEKAWVDLPIAKEAAERLPESSHLASLNVVDTAVQQIRELRGTESDNNAFKEGVYKVLEQVFRTIQDEVRDVARGADEFTPEADSLLDSALRRLESIAEQGSSAREQRAKKLAEMARDALTSYSSLYRSLSLKSEEGQTDVREGDPVYNLDAIDYASADDKKLHSFLVESAKAVFRETPAESDSAGSIFADKLARWPHRSLQRGRSSLIPMPKPVLVPGGRFVEGYYWDTYWIIRGLCVAGKTSDALDMLDNFFSAVDRFGFIPNGCRQYYLDRSQPPVLSQSVRVVLDALEATGQNKEADNLLQNAVPRLLEEYFSFWMNPARGHVVVLNKEGRLDEQQQPVDNKTINLSFNNLLEALKTGEFVLNRYYSSEATFRPESHVADKAVFSLLKGSQVDSVMRSIRSAAESGWDFSFRWSRRYFASVNTTQETNNLDPTFKCQRPQADDPHFRQMAENGIRNAETRTHAAEFFKHIDTVHVAPVDLNALMYQFEKNMIYFVTRLINLPQFVTADVQESLRQYVEYFELARRARAHTMHSLMKDTETGVWKDFDILTGRISCIVSAASAVPVWADLDDDYKTLASTSFDEKESTAMEKSVSLPFDIFKGWGIVPTPFESGQQWDFPNVWPPLIHFVIEVLDRNRAPWDFSPSANKLELTEKSRTSPLGFRKGLKLARNFIQASLFAYTKLKAANQPGYFYEKFNTTDLARGGEGGEYENQVGFGWTNGVILEIVARYHTLLI